MDKSEYSLDHVDIELHSNSKGFIYALHPLTIDRLKKMFNANPVNSISVKYELKEDYEKQSKSFFQSIYPILLGLSNDSLKKINQINLVDPFTRKVIVSNAN